MNTPQEFGPLLAGLRALAARGFADGGALATLVRTRGSTFRRAGARMLVCGDGSVVRGLSGGCPEADIIGRAHGVIAARSAELVRYNREYGLDALMELGCGGELEVLIEPLFGPAQTHFAECIAECIGARRNGILATAYTVGDQCLTPGPRRLVLRESEAMLDEFDDPRLRDAVLESLAALPADVRANVLRLEGAGGSTEVLIETIQPPWALLIIGVNAGSLALARIAAGLGWSVTLVDHRDDAPLPPGLPEGLRPVVARPESLAAHAPLDTRSFAVVMTHNLERDIDYLRAMSGQPLAYLGALGSRQRVQYLRDGCGPELAQGLCVPAGLDLGAETPEEIALAIAAEIVAVTNGREGRPLHLGDQALH